MQCGLQGSKGKYFSPRTLVMKTSPADYGPGGLEVKPYPKTFKSGFPKRETEGCFCNFSMCFCFLGRIKSDLGRILELPQRT